MWGLGFVTGEEGPNVFTVDAVLGKLGPDQVGDGGQDVYGHRGFAADRVGGDCPGHPRESGFAATAIEHRPLALA